MIPVDVSPVLGLLVVGYYALPVIILGVVVWAIVRLARKK